MHSRRTFVSMSALACLAAAAPAAHAETGFTTRFVDITAADGVKLKAMVMEPRTPGPHPAAVLISAWGGGCTQNVMPARDLAARGYVVVAYGARGFGESGGEVDTAGPKDVADVTTVLDWTTANTATDPERIGVAGVSYGAGIGVIAAAFDNRIRSVVSLSGWFDLVHSLYGNQTRRGLVALVLYTSGWGHGRLSPETDWMLRTYFDPTPDPVDREVINEWARVRSPSRYLDRLNENRPALLIGHTWSETVFPPDQMVELYEDYTGPKRIDLIPGEHASAESGGLLGLPSETWDTALRWFDATVAGTDTSILGEDPVVLRARPGTHDPETYPDWRAAEGEPQHLFLGPGPDDGVIGDAPRPGWRVEIDASRDTIATGGVPLATYSFEALTGEPPRAWLPGIDREHGAVWTSPEFPDGLRVRGSVHLHLTVIPPGETGTIVAYLYDVDSTGTGRLINYLPLSWTDAIPGAEMPVDLRFSPTAYDIPADGRLALVIDTADPLFIDWNSGGGQVVLTSPEADPSRVDVPVRRGEESAR
ncbi:CocE/NonD family hydrolase [Saccharopolyspora sp. ID03-671]|uniref:alpha/beta fold hydrolase n=1 Tax=Saccharopolyspora sp. ID03-671 TaxID=3073066 RepID=UPI00324523CA